MVNIIAAVFLDLTVGSVLRIPIFQRKIYQHRRKTYHHNHQHPSVSVPVKGCIKLAVDFVPKTK